MFCRLPYLGKTFELIFKRYTMLKAKIIIPICTLLLLSIQCKSPVKVVDEASQTEETIPQMEERKSPFAQAEIRFHKWVTGTQGGGSGIDMTFGWTFLPDNLVMKKAYFRELSAPMKQDRNGYSAYFRNGQNTPQDVIMHSDPLQEAANTPSVKPSRFPVKLTDQQVGVIYEEDGHQLVYMIMENLVEESPVAYPSAPPSEKGN